MRFVINEEKRTIVAIIDDCKFDLCRYVENRSGSVIIAYGYCNDDLILKDHYSGVAKCAPDDEWDETYGKKLAYRRAMRAYEKDRMNKLRKIVHRYNDVFSAMLGDQEQRVSYYTKWAESV